MKTLIILGAIIIILVAFVMVGVYNDKYEAGVEEGQKISAENVIISLMGALEKCTILTIYDGERTMEIIDVSCLS